MYVGVLAVIGLYTMHLWLPQLYEYLFNAKKYYFSYAMQLFLLLSPGHNMN
jgi:hypothetical protein